MMNQKPDSLSAKPSVVENDVKQEVERNQGVVLGQMNDSQAFFDAVNIIYQNIPSQVLSQQKKSIPSLLPYLVDRKTQKEELENTIETHLKQQRNNILVCVIHGDE